MRPEVRHAARRVRQRVTSGGPALPSSRSADRKLILRSGLFDQRWVEAQLGRAYSSADDAVDAYLDAPDCSPHPLFLADWIEGRFERPLKGVDPLLWFLRDERARHRAPTHPLLNTKVISELDPRYDDPPMGRVVAWLADATPDTPMPSTPGTPTLTLGEVVELSHAALRDWSTGVRHRNAPRTGPRPPSPTLAPHGPALSESGDAPLVSIVMPLWNRAGVVRRAVESVQAQTHQDWELIIVDDGSDDESLPIITGLASFDPRIVCVAAAHGGVSRARNTGVDRARGTYVAFLDTDNTWRPDFLHVMLTELEAHGWDMAHAALRAEKDGTEYFRAFEGTHAHLLVANHVDLNVLVVRKTAVDAVRGFDETLRRGVDYDLILKLAARTDLHLVPYIGVDYRDDEDAGPRISTTESTGWLSVIASRHLVDWPAVAAAPRTSGLTTVVLPLRGSLRATLRWLYLLADVEDVEVVLVGVRLPLWQHVAVSVVSAALGHSRLVALQVNRGTATSLNVGFAAGTGDRALLVLGHAEPDRLAIAELTRTLDDDAVAVAQPLVTGEDDVIASAGAVFGRSTSRPEPFLRHHPVADAVRAGSRPVPAALGSVVAVRSDVLAALGGLEPLYGEHYTETDLSLRAQSSGLGRTQLCVTSAFVTRTSVLPTDPVELAGALRVFDERFASPPPGSDDAWQAAGFEVVGRQLEVVDASPPGPLDTPMLAPRTVLRPLRAVSITEAAPTLRWTIDLAARAGRQGKGWGDLHYGVALANALRRRGQQVSVDPREARHRATRSYDDVILVLRGLDRVTPRPECLNIQWIISHPDLVSAPELSAFDLVYAASASWSAKTSAAWGLDVRPLLQATDPMLFHPSRADFDTGSDVLFVGNSRGVHRTSVRAALAARAEVAVHGRGWNDVLPPELIHSQLVDNADLGALYAAAGVVLNDHWEDMRLTGFVSNRLMDAAASGARVVSDSIPGLDLPTMFHGLVQTFETDADMARLLADRATVFPDDAQRVAAAEAVAGEHSFDARATIIIDDAVAVLRARGEGRVP